GTQLAAERRPRQEELEPDEERDGDAEDEDVELADVDLARQCPAGEAEIADVERVDVGAELLEQQVLDHDRETERRQQRHENARAQAPLEQGSLQGPAEDGQRRQHDRERGERGEPVVRHDEDEERPEDCEVAVGEVDDPHHAEHQRQAAGQQRVVAAEQHPLNDLVEPGHGWLPATAPRRSPKYASVTCSRVSSPALPSSTIRPSGMHVTRLATESARFRSCSTSTTVAPPSISVCSER